MGELRIFCLGGCNLRQPIKSRAWPGPYDFAGPPFFTYTLGEMRQALAAYAGEIVIPRGLLRLCNLRPDTAPTPDRSPLGAYDVALVEPNTSIEITLDGVHINRRPIWQLLMPLRQLGPRAVRALARWYEKGIGGVDPDARREAAADLIPLVPSDWPRAGLIRRVVGKAVSQSPPLSAPLAELVGRLAAPVGVVLFNWTYMPDGRPVGWPVGFRAEVIAAAEALGLPIFDPADLIRRVGVENALAGDFRHYTRSFLPIIGRPLVDFVFTIAESRGAPGSPRGRLEAG